VPKIYQVDRVIPFFDSRLKSLRQSSFQAFALQSPVAQLPPAPSPTPQSPAEMDPAFWARLFESPYDDVRIELVNRLKTQANLPGASAESTSTLWQTVLLNIHRGGRAKLSALRQISDRITREPQSAKTLLPVLAIALRSVRGPEARHGLAAVVSAVEAIPSLAEDVKRSLPELQLDLAEAAR
jgi:hypothetical protein